MNTLYIKVTSAFEKKAQELLSEDALEDLYDFLYANPESGSLIRGSGGVRKLRWTTGKDNRGKSGGVRVLYHYSKGLLVLLITLYSKTEKENITDKECNELKRIMPQLIEKYKGDL